MLMDIGLPYFNGYHWCMQIRNISKVPVVFMPSMSDNMNIVMAINMGGDDFIVKPFDINVLIAKVQAMLISVLLYAAVCTVSAIYRKYDSIYKARSIITCQKQCSTDKLFRIAESSHRCSGDYLFCSRSRCTVTVE